MADEVKLRVSGLFEWIEHYAQVDVPGSDVTHLSAWRGPIGIIILRISNFSLPRPNTTLENFSDDGVFKFLFFNA